MPEAQFHRQGSQRLAEVRIQLGIGSPVVRCRTGEKGIALLVIQRQQTVAQGRGVLFRPAISQADAVKDGFQTGCTVVAACVPFPTIPAGREPVGPLQSGFLAGGAVRAVMRGGHAGQPAAQSLHFRRQGKHVFDKIVRIQDMTVRFSLRTDFLLQSRGCRSACPLGKLADIVQPCRKHGEFMLHALSPSVPELVRGGHAGTRAFSVCNASHFKPYGLSFRGKSAVFPLTLGRAALRRLAFYLFPKLKRSRRATHFSLLSVA